jgi:hypothetical protein
VGERDHAVDIGKVGQRVVAGERIFPETSATRLATWALEFTEARMPIQLRVATRSSGRPMPSKVAGGSKFGVGLKSTPKA